MGPGQPKQLVWSEHVYEEPYELVFTAYQHYPLFVKLRTILLYDRAYE